MKFNLKLILLSVVLIALDLGLMSFSIDKSLNFENKPQGKKLSKLNEEALFVHPMLNWNENYEKTIEFIKRNEGFAAEMYICPGGYQTIGYGHVILEGENFGELTEKQADSLLRADFKRAVKAVESTIDLPANQKLAMAHFVFNKGIGTFINSGLKDKIEKGLPIDGQLMQMCYYTNKDGKRIKSQLALNIRKWEINLFNQKS
ncbi:MAG: lysozyme [Bacteroidales bacterium]